MPKARAIVATTNPKTGEPIAAGAEVDLDDEAYQALRQQGAIEASEEEQKAGQRDPQGGVYDARTGREQAGGEHPHGGPPGRTGEHPQGGPPGQEPQAEPKKK